MARRLTLGREPETANGRAGDSARGARAGLGAWLDRLAYQAEPGRDLRIDFLRGFAVLAMVVDHLGGPSPLYALTGGNRFFTSAAEGFVFVSGIVVGLVYRRIAARDGLTSALRRLLGRAWQLYVLAVGLTLVMLLASELLNLPWAQGVDLRRGPALVWSILTLHQTYYLVDIPLLYALLLGVAPLAFFLMEERRTWVVLLASWAIWAGYQVYPERTELPWPIAGNYLFYFAAWQVLFFTGMAMGYHRERLQRIVPRAWQRGLLVASGVGFVALLLAYRRLDALLGAVDPSATALQGGRSFATDLVDVLLAKGDVRLGRIVASAIVFGFLFLLTSQFWVPLQRALAWLLLPLGQNALFAYSAHVAIALGLGFIATARGRPTTSPTVNAAIQVGGILLIWLAIRHRVLYPTPATRARWMASVVPLTIVVLGILPLDPSPDLPGLASAPTPAATVNDRAVRRFGTPVPRTQPGTASAAPAPQGAAPAPPARAPTPLALPPPAPGVDNPGPQVLGETRVSEYVGMLRGRFRERTFYSAALDREMPYFIYLPPGYGTERRRYPVVYLLHGASGDKEEWPAYGMVDAVDRLIDSKELRPMIIIFPQGDFGYWIDHVDNGPQWGTYIARDLVRYVDATFRTLPDPQHRAIGGLSMGAYGALSLAFSRPSVFGVVAANSPSLREDDGNFTIAGTGEEFARRDPISLAATAPGIESLKIWIDVGEDDPWLERAQVLNQVLAARGVAHDFVVLPGGHEGAYWEANVVRYLRFYDAALN